MTLKKLILLFILAEIFMSIEAVAQIPKSDKTAIYEPINYLDSLKNNEFFAIKFTSDGCFHNLTQKIEIFKINNSFHLRLYPEKWFAYDEANDAYALKEKSKDIILNSDQIEELRIFQVNVAIYNCVTCGCTTEDKYEFLFKRSTKTYTDSGCYWHGMSKLVKTLFKSS